MIYVTSLSEAFDIQAGMTNQDDVVDEYCGYCGGLMEESSSICSDDKVCPACERAEQRRNERLGPEDR